MALNIEAVSDDLILFLRQALPPQIDAVRARADGDTRIPLQVPQASSYFLGEWSRFRSYVLPAVFIVPNRTGRLRGSREQQLTQGWSHSLYAAFLLEGSEEQQLTRACFRMADAAVCALDEQPIDRPGTSLERATKVRVEAIDYGPMIVSKQSERSFRKDVFLTLAIEHSDLRTPTGR